MAGTKERAGEPPSVESLERLVFDASSEGVIVLCPGAGRVTAVNRGLVDMTGLAAEDVVGADVSVLFPKGHPGVARWREILSQPGLHEEVPVRGRDGAVIDADVSVCKASLHGEAVTVLLVRDCSARRDLERELIQGHIELRRAYDALEEMRAQLFRAEKLAAIGRFAAGVSHEVNNPAAFVLANLLHLKERAPSFAELANRYVRVLREGPGAIDATVRSRDEAVAAEVGEVLVDLVDDAVEGMRRIRATTRQLAAFSHAARGRVVTLDVNGTILASVQLLGRGLSCGGRVVTDLAADLPLVRCRQGALEQILTNLLVNADEAMAGRGPERAALHLRTRLVDDAVVIDVTDTGPGIPEELLQRVFDPFFTTKQKGHAAGLGLALSQEIASQHRGRIEIRSVVGEGTTMTVRIPVDTGLEGPDATTAEPADGARKPPPKRFRVLVIDDEPTLLRSLKRVLSTRFDVSIAVGGRAGLETLERDPEFDVILLDVIMPGVDGREVLARLGAMRPALVRRVLLMSGGTSADVAAGIPEAPRARMLQKPFDNELLVAAIEEIARGAG